jgi:hypothetical protein
VTDPISARIETADEVRDLVLEAAKFVDPARLGTTDNCGFSPFGDDTSTSRETAFAKIRARVQGTAMASESDPAAASPRSSRSRNVEDVDHLGVSFVACGVMAWYAPQVHPGAAGAQRQVRLHHPRGDELEQDHDDRHGCVGSRVVARSVLGGPGPGFRL